MSSFSSTMTADRRAISSNRQLAAFCCGRRFLRFNPLLEGFVDVPVEIALEDLRFPQQQQQLVLEGYKRFGESLFLLA
jgi:hypothetical protein